MRIVVYDSKTSLGQICVYDFGYKNLPTGIGSKEFRQALKMAEDGMTQLIATPPYRNGKLSGTGQPEIEGEGRKAHAEMRLFTSELALPDRAPVQNVHLILMTTGLGKFLKLDYTADNMAPAALAKETRQVIEAFVQANEETMKNLLQ